MHGSADAVIIGGGPAGAVAARLLSAWGHSMLVLARPTPLGSLAESIPPSARKLFERIGVLAAVDGGGFLRSTGNTVWWGGAAHVAPFPANGRGYQVARDAFDALLLRLAEEAGARVLRGEVARRVEPAEGSKPGWRILFESETGVRTASARWVLDCSGRAGVLARHGWRRAESDVRTLALIATWEKPGGWGLDDESHTLVESFEAGWAWSVPISPTRRCFALMLDPSLTELVGRRRLADVYTAELAKTARFRELTATASISIPPWACDASTYGAARVSGDGALLVGDAASFVDPLSSFGVKKALASAWLAAVVVHTCLTEPHLQTAALELHEKRERIMYESLQRRSAHFAQSAAGRHAHDFWLERGAADVTDDGGQPDVEALRRDPDVLRAFDELKRSDSIALRPSASARRAELPIVRGNRVTLATHLVTPAFPEGIRYVRDIDLVALAGLASGFRQVPDLYEAYNRAAPPVALPDFLGALSLLLGKGMLEHA
jgi:flavin-dependent dehydrogenase